MSKHLASPPGQLQAGGIPVSDQVRVVARPLAPGHTAPALTKPMARPVVQVQRRKIAYWEEAGWVRSGAEFTGRYCVGNFSFRGRAIQLAGGEVEMFVENTPDLRSLMKDRAHWACFGFYSLHWYRVHTTSGVSDVSAGLLEIEAILKEAHDSKLQPPSHPPVNAYESLTTSPLADLLRRLIP